MSSGSIRFVPQRQSITNLATNATRGVKRVMLGSLTYNRESNYEQRLDKIRSTEAIDNKFGYQRCTGCETRDAWPINVHPVVPRKRARDEEGEMLVESGKEQKQLERSSVNEQLPFKKQMIVADGVVAWIRSVQL
ncbi:unnamed protein product [Toxocara canis]|uniref:Uncharacterized protein n=1 Tax=Toxocara canis TaxID=6265 RepID=A0A183VE56_TOXCA|nr:unnamed protein product [Toxocara canis]